MYVGIDQSYSGFAVTFLWEDGTHRTVVKKFDPKKHGTGVDRLNDIAAWLTLEISQSNDTEMIDHVCMEGYANGAKFGREQAGELGGRVKQVLRKTIPGDYGYPTIVAPSALKKFATGKGTGVKKNQILLAVYRKWDVEFTDDNAADSYVLAKVAEAADGESRVPLLAYEQEVVSALRIHTEK